MLHLRFIQSSFLLSCVSIFACTFALSARTYAFTTFDVPGSSNGTQAVSINDSGTITGSYIDPNNYFHGYIRAANGTITTFDAPSDLPPSGSNGTKPVAINNLGIVAGTVPESADNGDEQPQVGFLRSLNDDYTLVPLSSQDTNITGLNATGFCLGYTIGGASGAPNTSFLRYPSGRTVRIVYPGANYTIASAINSSETVTGWFDAGSASAVGFTRSLGGAYSSFSIEGAPYTEPEAINDAGVIAGEAGFGTAGFLRYPDGSATLFESPTGSLTATGIDNRNDVVGYFNQSSGSGNTNGFVRLASGQFISLSVVGSTSSKATGINSAGVIVGTYFTAEGNLQTPHGFVAMPSN